MSARLMSNMEKASSSSGSDDDAESFASADADLGELEEVEVEENAYGAATFSIVTDGLDILSGSDHDDKSSGENCLRLTFTIVSLIVNYVLQLFLLDCTWIYVARPSVHKVQLTYAAYHAQCYTSDGSYNQTAWESWSEDKQHELCSVVFAQHDKMLFALLTLWWMTMLNEIRQNQRTAQMFANIASCKNSKMIETDDEGALKLVRLNLPLRAFLYVAIVIPKFLISIILLIVGTVWLAATESFGDLLLNAVALEFIIQIDETIFEAMFPVSFKKQVGTLSLCPPKPKGNSTVKGFLRSCGYYALIWVALYFYLSPWGQAVPLIGVLPGYENDAACPIHWGMMNELRCDSRAAGSCFPKGGR